MLGQFQNARVYLHCLIVKAKGPPGAIQAGLVEIGVEVAAYPLMSLSRSLLSCMM